MHPRILEVVIKVCRQRISEGDFPSVSPQPIETLEEAVDDLATKVSALTEAVNSHAANLARIAELEAALKEIADAHLGDQPAEAPGDDYAWACQHIGKLRRIALDAMSTPS